MTFEKTIKTISSFFATLVIFVLALGIYLSSKGFVMDAEGNLVLVNSAYAKSVEKDNADSKVDISKINISVEAPFLGEENAPVTLYEYSSYGCSHCQDFHIHTLPKLKKELIDTGKLKLVFVDFPLDKKSMQGAMLSHCIPDENYYEFLDIVFKNQSEWAYKMRFEKIFASYAELFGINAREAEKCMKDADIQNRILANRQQGIEAFKIQGTPSFVIENKNRKEVIHGAASFEDFKKIIEEFAQEK